MVYMAQKTGPKWLNPSHLNKYRFLSLTTKVFLLFAVTVTFSSAVYGGVIRTDGNEITGIDNLAFGGGLYNISFTGFGQSYNEVFPGALDITDAGTAIGILDAIIADLNGTSPNGIAEWKNTDMQGALVSEIFYNSDLYLPYASTSQDYGLVQSIDWDQHHYLWQRSPGTTIYKPYSLPNNETYSGGWIRVSPAAVPEPMSITLFLAGLLGLGYFRKKHS